MMELKKFEAPTLAQALQVVKKELGPDAIIISTRNNKSGFGILGGSSVEVTAAVSREALERKEAAEARLSRDQLEALHNKPSRKVSRAYEVLSGATLEKKMAQARSTFFDGGRDSIA